MKHLNTIGLLVIAAAVLMALAGTGSALANTILCEHGSALSPNLGCQGVPGGHERESTAAKSTATSTNVTLVTNLGTVTCPISSTTLEPEGATPKAGETTITGKVSALSFGPGCDLSGMPPCEVTVNNLPYTAHLHGTWEGKTNTSILTVTSLSVRAKCGSFLNCTFGSPEVTLMGDNATPTATFKAEGVELNREGGLFCPNSSILTVNYSVTAPAGFTVH